MKPALLLAVAIALGTVLVTPEARADRPTQGQHAGITLDEAVKRAERKYHARVIRAETRESQGRRVHVLRLLSDDGRVWSVKIDAASGAEI